MKKILYTLLVFCLNSTIAVSQNGIAIGKVKDPEKPVTRHSFMLFKPASAFDIKNAPLLPALCFSNPLGFFCKAEIHLEKHTGIPFRFRLGSIEYTNSLERK